jgi:predicted GH43/DUF377 family glycosyl hydrolase
LRGDDIHIGVRPFEFIPLGVASINNKIFLFSKITRDEGKVSLQAAFSQDGFNFEITESPQIIGKGKEEKYEKCSDFRFASSNGGYFLAYKLLTGKKSKIYGAISNDLIRWRRIGKLPFQESVAPVPSYKFGGKYAIYFGEKSIRVAFSKNFRKWKVLSDPLIEPRPNYFDRRFLEVGNCVTIDEGILLIYYVKDENAYYSIGTALLDKSNPTRILQRSSEAIWINERLNGGAYPVGVARLNGKFVSYWNVEGEGIKAVIFSPAFQVRPILEKFERNPIIQPIPEHAWESKATFNTAAVYEGGKVHLVYRAIGDDATSVLGYASSKDGLHIDERLSEPIFSSTIQERSESENPKHISPFYSPIVGWRGGCEDPRITKIEDRFYMTYVHFDGKTSPRLALTSIKVKDFRRKKWKWEKPVLISPPGIVDKNGCILSEKIDGKYVIFHRIFPNILIDFVDSLDFDGKTWLKGQFSIGPRKGMWDSRKVGAGPPPIKTKDGWLLIYHAIGDHDPSRYKVGAMLLDLKNPTKVLYRTKNPILEPTQRYENEGHKFGVVYPCGAVVIKERLFVYYGGADTVCCVATANLKEFVEELKSSEMPKLEPVTIRGF